MWILRHRRRYDRSTLRLPGNLTDAGCALIDPLIPPAKRRGNTRTVRVREVVTGAMYILSMDCSWAALPKDLRPHSTVNDSFRLSDDDGALDRIHHPRYVQCSEHAGREASPTAAVMEARASCARKKGSRSTRGGLTSPRRTEA